LQRLAAVLVAAGAAYALASNSHEERLLGMLTTDVEARELYEVAQPGSELPARGDLLCWHQHEAGRRWVNACRGHPP